MHDGYNPTETEAKWQKLWAEKGVYKTDLKNAKDPYYALVMFPYPSGDKLHVGHWYNFAPADSAARYQRMKGKDVFSPMGFDAFGLPAENYAIKTGVPPAKSTAQNVQTMIKQLSRIGTMYDWDQMVNTSDPSYYRWTQWLFLQMYKNKLAYKKLGNVNFCPKDQTVLANEQVWEGKCERCGTEVIQKPLEQWYWQTTKYSDQLLEGLDTLDWPEKTKLMQRNWIGKSQGAEIEFAIDGSNEKITVFTTRCDTLFGVTYVVIAPEHSLVEKVVTEGQRAKVETYKAEVKKKTELQRQIDTEKTGVSTGAHVIHPVTGKKLPLWVADYVLASYGTGAVMAVPGHDERDHAFAKKYKLPIVEVVTGGDVEKAAFTEPGICTHSDFLDGLGTEEAKKVMTAWLEKNKKGRGVTQYRLKDWLLSRQRYWGAPIPVVYDPKGEPHPVPEEHLPWTLPTDVKFKPTGESPLKASKEFKERTEKIFGKGWTPEYDTMDTFVCSSFYYLMYLRSDERLAMSDQKKTHSSQLTAHSFIDPAIEKKWMPVSMYIGGPEHACMHLIYARFVMMALKDFGYVTHSEPFQRLVHQGLITHKGAKMSKSKGNVVSPDEFIDRHGSDVFRMYLMFMGPFTDGGDWSDTGIRGIDRFVQRVWKVFGQEIKEHKEIKELKEVTTALHQAIKKVTESMEKMHFNTAISALMEFLNVVEGKEYTDATAQTFTRLLAPLAPHLAEELWEKWGVPASAKDSAGKKGFAIEQQWPEYDEKFLKTDTLTIAVQVNGKLRATISVPSEISEKDVIAAAKADPSVQKHMEGKTPKKEIYVRGKLVSLVI